MALGVDGAKGATEGADAERAVAEGAAGTDVAMRVATGKGDCRSDDTNVLTGAASGAVAVRTGTGAVVNVVGMGGGW